MTKRLSGLYFVLDLSNSSDKTLRILEDALRGGTDIVQVWSGAGEEISHDAMATVRSLTRDYGVPLIVNNNILLARKVGADGVHMDNFDVTPDEIRRQVGENGIIGYTVGNDLSRVKWAEENGADYISFCSIFPSSSVIDCELVPLETVRRARSIAKIPIFASGGINLSNASQVMLAGTDGIAVISAIQKAENPGETARKFKELIAAAIPSSRV